MKKALIALVCCAAIHAHAKSCADVRMAIEVAAASRDGGIPPAQAIENLKSYEDGKFSLSELNQIVDIAYHNPSLTNLHGQDLKNALTFICDSGP
jgi:hypothetical protein